VTRASRVIEQIVPVDFHSALTTDGAPLRDALPGDEESVLEKLERRADHEEVARAIRALPERERAVIERYYYQRRSLADIGAELGVTESRACQVHRSALRLLEGLLEAASA
jgi:RNA polymerase sigma factor for flagellar operon FliA